MRRIARLLAVIVLSIVSLGVVGPVSGPAFACSCLPRTASEVVAEAGAIVQGRPIAESEQGIDRVYTFAVDASYKQRVHERIEIATSLVSASCGVELEIGRDRTLALRLGTPIGGSAEGPPRWTAALCDNISSLGAGPLPEAAGPRLPPLAGSERPGDLPDASGEETTNDAASGSPPWWAVTLVVLVGVVVVGGGVVIAARQSRR